MYRLLIVDDEAGHRAGLIGLLRSIKPEYLVFEAENGAVALSMMDAMDFDLVLTDIRMPRVDGLDFLERAKAMHARVRIAILSAYDVFDYAKRSVALGADDYLLKPVDPDELNRCLDRMENRLVPQRAKEDGHNVETKLHLFVTGALQEAERREMRALFQEGDAGAVCCALPVDGWRGDEAREALKHALRGRLKQLGSAVVFRSPVERDVLTGIVSFSLDRARDMAAALDEVLAELWQRHGQKVVVGYTVVAGGLFAHLEDAHNRARAVCMRHFFEPDRHVFEADGSVSFDPYQTMRLDVSIKAMDQGLCAGAVEQTLQLLTAEIERLCVPGAYPSKIKEVIMYTFLFLLSNLSYPLPREAKDEILLSIDKSVLESRSLGDMMAGVRAALARIASAIEQSRGNQHDEVFQEVLRYLDARFSEDLSLAFVAERFHYHPSYFSTLFKQNVGSTFSDYLFDLRMREAARLLIKTQLFASKVGEKVGYPSAAYFTKAFKKRFGMSPDQYRKRGR